MSSPSYIEPTEFQRSSVELLSAHEHPVKVLLIEDSAVDALFIRRLLEREGELFEVSCCRSMAESKAPLLGGEMEVIVLDLNLQDSRGMSTYHRVRELAPDTPVVVLTAHDDRGLGFEAIRQGAQDYIIKGRVVGEVLVRSLLYALERKRLERVDRQEVRRSLEETKGKYQLLFEYESDPVIVLCLETFFFEEANLAAVQLFGYSKEEFRSVHALDISAEEDKTLAHLKGAWSGKEQTYRIAARQFRKRDGSEFTGEISVRLFSAGGHPKMLASIRDITERQAMELALRNSEARFRMLLEQATDAFFLHDLEGRILDVNQCACDTLQLSREELLGLMISEINPAFRAISLKQLWMSLDGGREPRTMEGLHLRRDGDSFPVEVRVGRFDSTQQPLLLSLARDITQRKKAEAQRLFAAYHDALTRLPNRTRFLQRLGELVPSPRASQVPFAVVFIDLDRFKKINDSLGHELGDLLITETAIRLKALLGSDDLLSRLSADEFALLLHMSPGQGTERVEEIVSRVQALFLEPFSIRKHNIFCTVSLGISLSTNGYSQALDILRDAEIAVHRAKDAGRNRAVVFDQVMREEAIRLHQIETDLRLAIERKEFVVYYQPIVDLQTDHTIGFEALVRWVHPDKGLLPPGAFISVAEDFGLITPMGWQVLESAVQQTKRWHQMFPEREPIQISVNVASLQFESGELLERVQKTLQESDFPSECLKLEMTESTLMHHSKEVQSVLDCLAQMGIRLSVDDFGTGYSSLSYLHRFPVQVLKIDRSFVSHMEPGNHHDQIIQTIIALSRALGLLVIAEGIEDRHQYTRLRELGCHYAQGFYISPPIDAASAEAFLKQPLSWVEHLG